LVLICKIFSAFSMLNHFSTEIEYVIPATFCLSMYCSQLKQELCRYDDFFG
jgi:hypothetical protein